MTTYLQTGSVLRIADKRDLVTTENLNSEYYVVRFDEMRKEYFLELAEPFTLPKKLYGDIKERCDRVLETFFSRTKSTGVLLSGEKGSGKSQLAKLIAIEGQKRGLPTIIVSSAFCGELFNKFIQRIDDRAIILFDEFEKTYDERSDQEAILTLFDGVYPTTKLFVLTVNDKYRLDDNLRNRPGRLYYSYDYKGLPEKFIREYLDDCLKNPAYYDRVLQFTSLFSQFNFDMLSALVEEINRYDEDPFKLVHCLNVKPEYSEDVTYSVQLFNAPEKGGKVREVQPQRETTRFNPAKPSEEFIMYGSYSNKCQADRGKEFYFEPINGDIKEIKNNGKYIKLVNEDGQTAILIRVEKKEYDYSTYMPF